MQQWAGTAPGYMVYQHGAAGGPAGGGGVQPVRLSGGAAGVYAGMVPAPSGGAASAPLSPMASMGSGSWGVGVGPAGALSPRHPGGQLSSAFVGAHGGAYAPAQHGQYTHGSPHVRQYRRSDSSGSSAAAASSRGSLEAEAAVAAADTRSNNRAGGNGPARAAVGDAEPPRQAAAAAEALQEWEHRQEAGNNDDEGHHKQTAGGGARSGTASQKPEQAEHAQQAEQAQQAQQAATPDGSVDDDGAAQAAAAPGSTARYADANHALPDGGLLAPGSPEDDSTGAPCLRGRPFRRHGGRPLADLTTAGPLPPPARACVPRLCAAPVCRACGPRLCAPALLLPPYPAARSLRPSRARFNRALWTGPLPLRPASGSLTSAPPTT